jgi:hypothetical protein
MSLPSGNQAKRVRSRRAGRADRPVAGDRAVRHRCGITRHRQPGRPPYVGTGWVLDGTRLSDSVVGSGST